MKWPVALGIVFAFLMTPPVAEGQCTTQENRRGTITALGTHYRFAAISERNGIRVKFLELMRDDRVEIRGCQDVGIFNAQKL